MSATPPEPDRETGERWTFLRDVLVFQGKLVLDGLRDILLFPVTLGAAAIDVVAGGRKQGERFYSVLRAGRRAEHWVNLFGAVERREGGGRATAHNDPTVDALVARLESVILREYAKGGAAANVKSSIDRAIDDMQREAEIARESARETAARLAETIRTRMEKAKPANGDS